MFLEDLIGQPVFRHRGKRYRLRAAGSRSLSLLRDVARNPRYQSWDDLLRLRPRIRSALAAPAPVALSSAVDRTKYTRGIRMAIWLLGRIGNPYATPSVLSQVNHPDFRVQREAIRALKRLHAWPQLARIEQSHVDARIRALAKVRPPRPYSERLAGFVARSKRIEHGVIVHSLVLAPGAEVGGGRPPKSRWQIGRVLRRIRRLVRGARRGWLWFVAGHLNRCFHRAHR